MSTQKHLYGDTFTTTTTSLIEDEISRLGLDFDGAGPVDSFVVAQSGNQSNLRISALQPSAGSVLIYPTSVAPLLEDLRKLMPENAGEEIWDILTKYNGDEDDEED
jgi:hypothetical protein